MRKTLGLSLAVETAAVLCVLGTLAANASWSVPLGTSTLIAHAAKMPRGVAPSAARQSGQAVVSWSAQEIAAGTKMDHYVVTAHSVDDPPRPDVSHIIAASGAAVESFTFAANEVGGGKWYWTVVPRFRLWTGAESSKSQRLTFPAGPVAAPSPAADLAPATLAPATSFPPDATPPSSPEVTPSAESPTPSSPPPPVESAAVPGELAPSVTSEPPTPVVLGSAGA